MNFSGNEKILVISPMVPRFDMNSGDLRLTTILKILAGKYEITFLSTSHKPGDEDYIRHLEQYGISVYAENFSFKQLLQENEFNFAILEFYFTAEYYLERIRLVQPSCRIIVDTVDVHYLRLFSKFQLSQSKTDHEIFVKTKEKEISIYRKADAVLAVTTDDALALVSECPDIYCEIVPNIHELRISDILPDENSLIFIGGFSHHPNVDAVLYLCDEIMPLIRAYKKDVKLWIVGSNPPEEIRNLKNEFVEVTGYVPETSSYLHKSLISVASLRYGAGMKGKIGEAMAHGVPVVTTSFGAQGMGLTNMKNVMIADSAQDFATSVLTLMSDCSLREAIRKNAIKVIDDNYTPEKVAQSIILALKRIESNAAKKMKFDEKAVFVLSYAVMLIKSRLFLNH